MSDSGRWGLGCQYRRWVASRFATDENAVGLEMEGRNVTADDMDYGLAAEGSRESALRRRIFSCCARAMKTKFNSGTFIHFDNRIRKKIQVVYHRVLHIHFHWAANDDF
jgi:hypothetical protein